ncbi:ABC transporter permease [Salibacterium qingdaonense]|uniref:NitT/TauT family transport system permease protein n=1 Tax=Salibacterium qingdaonense TaxID=266892 RepID=A0A1I4MZ80_9BACI|nr:ABC transporter permease [Salibacterium qingdaonense]SFM08642.1 NitT/TauT family transport system permease protein [Salibacterium qingdaonense]
MLNHSIKTQHRLYLQQKTKEKRRVLWTQSMLAVTFFILWEAASRLAWIDPLIFSMPSQIGLLFLEKVSDGSLLVHTSITLAETAAGFLLGSAGGALAAFLLWWSAFFSKVFDPYLVILNAMPKVALGPIIIVIFGPGILSIIAMATLLSIVITTIVVYHAFQQVDDNYKKVLLTFGATKKQLFHYAVLPACYPTIISTMKVNVGLAWVGVIVGEFLVAKQGLGYMIIYGFQVFQFRQVMLSLIVIAVLAAVMYKSIEALERFLISRRGR